MEKYTIAQVKKFSPALLNRLIDRAKKHLKTDPVMKKVFDEYEVDIEELEYIPTKFAELDVSARTDHGIIYLNFKLLCDGDFFRDFGYLVHEYSHWLQQTTGKNATRGSDDGDYLDNPHEVEGFQNQIEWLAQTFGKEDAEAYVSRMLDYHEMVGKERDDKEEELTENVGA